jgi:hypothetical protein
MCFPGHPSREEFSADRVSPTPQEVDLATDEWTNRPALPAGGDRVGVSTILSFWAIAAVLLIVIVAAPALEAAAHRLH